jgi:hypothetical protein
MGAALDVDAIIERLDAQRPDPADAPAVARWMLKALALPHVPVYSSPEVRSALAGLGITDPRAAYFAQRAAPLGAVPAQVVTATFYGFAPWVAASVIPDVWSIAAPDAVVTATVAAMGDTLRRLLPDAQDVARAMPLLRPVVALHPLGGRPLAAAWAAVPWTGDDAADLWLATTIVRESRGDGHIAALVTHGVGPLASHLLQNGDEPARRPKLIQNRGWSSEEIDEVAAQMRRDGLLAPDGQRTAAGLALSERVEQATDTASAIPWAAAGPELVTQVCDVALALARPMIASGTLSATALERLVPSEDSEHEG